MKVENPVAVSDRLIADHRKSDQKHDNLVLIDTVSKQPIFTTSNKNVSKVYLTNSLGVIYKEKPNSENEFQVVGLDGEVVLKVTNVLKENFGNVVFDRHKYFLPILNASGSNVAYSKKAGELIVFNIDTKVSKHFDNYGKRLRLNHELLYFAKQDDFPFLINLETEQSPNFSHFILNDIKSAEIQRWILVSLAFHQFNFLLMHTPEIFHIHGTNSQTIPLGDWVPLTESKPVGPGFLFRDFATGPGVIALKGDKDERYHVKGIEKPLDIGLPENARSIRFSKNFFGFIWEHDRSGQYFLAAMDYSQNKLLDPVPVYHPVGGKAHFGLGNHSIWYMSPNRLLTFKSASGNLLSDVYVDDEFIPMLSDPDDD